MLKRFFAFVLSGVIVLCFGGCTAEEVSAEITKTPVVAGVSDSVSMLVATNYCNSRGYDFVEHQTLTDCAVAVENGKFDYLLCSEYEAVSLTDFALKEKEKCDYKSQYGFCFSVDSLKLYNEFNSAISDLLYDGTIQKICDAHKNGSEYKNEFINGKPIRIIFIDGVSGFALVNDEGQVEGLEIDIVTAVCNSMGYSPVFSAGEYDEGFVALENGEADLIMSVDCQNSALSDDFMLTVPYLQIDYIVYEADIK